MNLLKAAEWLTLAVLHAINASARVRAMVTAAIARFQALVLIAKAGYVG